MPEFSEDPRREPHEKETALHLDGAEDHFSVTSFKKSVYEKLLQHPEFDVECVNVVDEDGWQSSVESLNAVGESESVIGVVGMLPVGCLSIGTARASDSHSGIVT